MNDRLTLGSLFDGSGGFPLGALISGITPVWASEIEPFPIRVTSKRLPFMKHYGDISKMDGRNIEPVDIITFGSPCTDMSLAGRRAGLGGQQSVLFYQAIRIIKEMRCATNGRYPRYIVWENVPGAFSSNKGEDFKAVLEAVVGIVEPGTPVPMPENAKWPYADCYMGNRWSVAYRTIDAQFWGVPQRRKRIYLVADFAGRSAFDVLFKSEGLSGYSAEGFRSWQRAAGNVAPCIGATGLDGYNGIVLNDQGGNRMDVTHEVTCTLRAEAHHPPCVMDEVALNHHPHDSRIKIEEGGVVQTLTNRMGTGGMNVPLLLKVRSGCDGGGKGALLQENKSATLACNNDQTLFEPTAYGIGSYDSEGMKSSNPHAGFYEAVTARTIDKCGGHPGCNQGGMAIVEARNPYEHCYIIQGSMIGREIQNGPFGAGINEDVSFTLNTVDRHAVYAMTTGNYMQTAENQAPTLLARDYKDPSAVVYGIGRDTLNHGRNAKFNPTYEEELQPTLVAKGPGAIQRGYTVRRLTPTECARLQGFPDWWCAGLGTEEPSMDDLKYWYSVFEEYRRVSGKSTKAKTLKQIAKWLRNPHSDMAEYKLWGNGVALPCVVFVLSGIAWVAAKNEETE